MRLRNYSSTPVQRPSIARFRGWQERRRRSPLKVVQRNCKPNSVCVPHVRDGENHLSQQPIPESLVLSDRGADNSEPPIWPCTWRGFPCPGDLAPGGGLLHHLFTLTELFPARRYILCGTFRQPGLNRAAHVYLESYVAPRPAVFGLSSSTLPCGCWKRFSVPLNGSSIAQFAATTTSNERVAKGAGPRKYVLIVLRLQSRSPASSRGCGWYGSSLRSHRRNRQLPLSDYSLLDSGGTPPPP
jgi:hypothetical protein